MPSQNKRRKHNRISYRVIGAVAEMWGPLLPSPTMQSIDQVLRRNSLDPRKFPPYKSQRVRCSLEESGQETAAQLIRDYIECFKIQGFLETENPASIANFTELQNALAEIGAELSNSGVLNWDPKDLQPDSYVNIEFEDKLWTYDKNEQEIGKGGYGIVYQGWDESEKDVAIKMLPLNQGRDVRELLREIGNTRILRTKAPKSTEHVLIPIAEVEDTESLYIIMPYAEQGSLKKKLSLEGKFSIADSLDILEQITKGLTELSTIGVLHRDVKPDNVLYQDGRWKLADFGLSRFIENETASYTMAFKGSVGYTAPEVINQEPKTIRSDLYSVGVIAYEMLAGRKPFEGDRDQVREATLLEQPPSLAEEIPSPVRRIVTKLLKKRSAERYFNAQELLEAIKHAKNSETHPPSPLVRALTAREERTEAIYLSHELERRRGRELGDQKQLALSDLEEKIIQAIETVQRDEPTSVLNFDEKLNVWHLDIKGCGLAITIWDEIIEASEGHLKKLLHSGEIFLIPEPHPPATAYALNRLTRENRIPDGNVMCTENPTSGDPEWVLFSVNDTPPYAHGFNRTTFEQHWKKTNSTTPSPLNYTFNTKPLTKDVIVDLLVHAIEGRYLDYEFAGI